MFFLTSGSSQLLVFKDDQAADMSISDQKVEYSLGYLQPGQLLVLALTSSHTLLL